MALTPGTRVGSFEITAQIGAGGMGEVYRATDTNLARQVAIKVLPEGVASDADRLARFDREAKTLAALNHPNIAAIYGLERSPSTGSGQAGMTALVMELVEGPTLADRIAEGPIPVDEALAIAKQIAEALEAAHEQGIIHRDLKPANVKVRPDGTVKVLDFGLAKAMEPVGTASASQSLSPTLTTPAMTQAGLILGTAAYMAPEQAKGRPADRRSDVWAFGCVLYEMLTARRAFEAEDVSETLAAVLRAEVDWAALPRELSPTLRRYLQRCLERDPKQRIHDVADLRLAMQGVFDVAVGETREPVAETWSARQLLVVAAALAAGVAAGMAAWAFLSGPPVSSGTLSRLTATLPPDAPLVADATPTLNLAVSPDGRTIVYVTQGTRGPQLMMRSLDSLAVRPLTEPDVFLKNPFFSPDGEWVAYFAGSELKKVRIDGTSPPIRLARGLAEVPSGVWRDEEIIFENDYEGLFSVPDVGGEPTQLLAPDDAGSAYFHPVIVPGTDLLLLNVGPLDSPDIAVLELGSRATQTLLEDAWLVAYLSTGHLLFKREDVVLAAALDLESRRVGAPEPVLPGVAQDSALRMAQAVVSAAGHLVFVPEGDARGPSLLTWVDENGTREPLGELPPGASSVSVSPDGGTAVVGSRLVPRSVWLWDMSRRLRQLLDVEGTNPRWHPGGRQIGLGVGTSVLLYDVHDGSRTRLGEAPFAYPPTWTTDGKIVAYTRDRDIVAILDGGSEAEVIIGTDAVEFAPALSPDGRWLAYHAARNDGGRVYVTRFPSGTERTQVTASGGGEPLWSRDGRRLFFIEQGPEPGTAELRALEFGPDGPVGMPETLFRVRGPEMDYRADVLAPWGAGYDIGADGRFLMVWEPVVRHTELVVVQNWIAELRRRVPVD